MNCRVSALDKNMTNIINKRVSVIVQLYRGNISKSKVIPTFDRFVFKLSIISEESLFELT